MVVKISILSFLASTRIIVFPKSYCTKYPILISFFLLPLNAMLWFNNFEKITVQLSITFSSNLETKRQPFCAEFTE